MAALLLHQISRRFSLSSAVKILGMSLLIVAGQFFVQRTCSSPLPVFDQWGAEGGDLLQPWLRGELHPGAFFAPWAQHRIAWTRLLALALFQCNGQWDTQVEAIAATLLHAATAGLVAAILLRRLGRKQEDAILLCLVLLFGLPFGQENTLSGGFNSQYYFLILFTVTAIWGLASHQARTAGWWIGAVAATAAWFSVATGGLAALAVALWMGLRLARRDGSPRENWITMVVGLALGAGGLCLSIGVGQRVDLQPRSAAELFGRFAGLLAWPSQSAWAAPVAFAPFALLAWRTLRRRQNTGLSEAFLFPLGIFALLNTAALAYARNHYGGLGVSRYMDFLSIGALVNFCCVLVLWAEFSPETAAARSRVLFSLLTTIWLVVTGLGLSRLTTGNLSGDLQFVRTCGEHEVENVASFVARPDVADFVKKDPFDVMCERPAFVAGLLQDPQIREILPWQVRTSIPLLAASASPRVSKVLQDPRDPSKAAWLLLPGKDARPVYFRSRTISGLHAPDLYFPLISGLGEQASVALVDDRSGAVTWLQPDPQRTDWQWVLVKTPAGPFHVEAVVAAGSTQGVMFGNPREVGRLSAWVNPLLNSAAGFFFTGLGLWLAALYWPRPSPRTVTRLQQVPLNESALEALRAPAPSFQREPVPLNAVL